MPPTSSSSSSTPTALTLTDSGEVAVVPDAGSLSLVALHHARQRATRMVCRVGSFGSGNTMPASSPDRR
jgi:hypothetical protein